MTNGTIQKFCHRRLKSEGPTSVGSANWCQASVVCWVLAWHGFSVAAQPRKDPKNDQLKECRPKIIDKSNKPSGWVAEGQEYWCAHLLSGFDPVYVFCCNVRSSCLFVSVTTCLLFMLLGPDHSKCASSNALTDTVHMSPLGWNVILQQVMSPAGVRSVPALL